MEVPLVGACELWHMGSDWGVGTPGQDYCWWVCKMYFKWGTNLEWRTGHGQTPLKKISQKSLLATKFIKHREFCKGPKGPCLATFGSKNTLWGSYTPYPHKILATGLMVYMRFGSHSNQQSCPTDFYSWLQISKALSALYTCLVDKFISKNQPYCEHICIKRYHNIC